MTQESNALRLAQCIDFPSVHLGHEAAAELRRLHEVNQELLEALKLAKDQLEDWEVCIDGEWGDCRDLEELEADKALHPATRAVRAAIAKAEGQTK